MWYSTSSPAQTALRDQENLKYNKVLQFSLPNSAAVVYYSFSCSICFPSQEKTLQCYFLNKKTLNGIEKEMQCLLYLLRLNATPDGVSFQGEA